MTTIPLVVFALATPFVADSSRDAEWPAKLAIWLAGAAAYLAAWWAVTLLATVRARTTASAVLILAICWVATLLVIPSGVRLALDRSVPIPSRATLIQAQRVATAHADVAAPQPVLAAYLETDPSLKERYGPLLPNADKFEFASGHYYLVGEARDYMAESEVRPVLDRWDAARRRQEQLAVWLSVLSPAMLTQSVLLDAVGTGDSGLTHFRNAVGEFHRQWRAFFLPRVFDMQALGAKDYAVLPAFRYQPPASWGVIVDALPRISALILLAVIAVSFALPRRSAADA